MKIAGLKHDIHIVTHAIMKLNTMYDDAVVELLDSPIDTVNGNTEEYTSEPRTAKPLLAFEERNLSCEANNVTTKSNAVTYVLSALVNALIERVLPTLLPEANNMPVGTRINSRSGKAVQFDSFGLSFSLCLSSDKSGPPFSFARTDPCSLGNIQQTLPSLPRNFLSRGFFSFILGWGLEIPP